MQIRRLLALTLRAEAVKTVVILCLNRWPGRAQVVAEKSDSREGLLWGLVVGARCRWGVKMMILAQQWLTSRPTTCLVGRFWAQVASEPATTMQQSHQLIS